MLLTQQRQTEGQLEPKQVNKRFMAKVMIVDDDVELLEELNVILSFNNYEVEVISDSLLAFEKACELKPDVVILDLKMKIKDGFQLADELQHSFETKSIPLIAITGFFTQREHMLTMKMHGIKSMLFKPIDPRTLLLKIASVLEGAKNKGDQAL